MTLIVSSDIGQLKALLEECGDRVHVGVEQHVVAVARVGSADFFDPRSKLAPSEEIAVAFLRTSVRENQEERSVESLRNILRNRCWQAFMRGILIN